MRVSRYLWIRAAAGWICVHPCAYQISKAQTRDERTGGTYGRGKKGGRIKGAAAAAGGGGDRRDRRVKGPQTPRSYPAGVPKRGARGQAAALRTCNLPLDDRRLSGLTTGREYISTNLADAGLRSVARNNKATRLLTRPGQTTKSSAKDLSLRIVKLQSAS